MVTENVDADVEVLAAEGGRAVAAASSTTELAQVESELLGKRSALTRAHRRLGGLGPEERKEAGRRLNEARARLQAEIEFRRGNWPGRNGRRRSPPTASTSPRSSRIRSSPPRRGGTFTW